MQARLLEGFRSHYGRAPEFVARAPGRIEFIGNHTDYNGGPVLGAAVDRGVWVALARRSDGNRRFASESRAGTVELSASASGRLEGPRSWVNYPLGVLAALGEFGKAAPAGFDYLAASDLPIGAGLSSSAAIELASALAFLASVGEEASRETLVGIGRHAENRFVGVPSGVLDQGTSAFGRKDHLVFIDCRGPLFETVPLPAGAHFWIFNTHAKHALVDGLYAERHRECMEAARGLGVPLLADATLGSLAAAETRMSRAAVKRARHVIDEIARVGATVAALRRGDLAAVGRLLYASHQSSRVWFENSTRELDFLADRLTTEPAVHGARLTGGGFGGAVMAFTTGAFDAQQAKVVAAAYAERFGAAPEVVHAQTDDGASLVGIQRFRHKNG
jgi:galactokinase